MLAFGVGLCRLPAGRGFSFCRPKMTAATMATTTSTPRIEAYSTTGGLRRVPVGSGGVVMHEALPIRRRLESLPPAYVPRRPGTCVSMEEKIEPGRPKAADEQEGLAAGDSVMEDDLTEESDPTPQQRSDGADRTRLDP